MKGRIAIFIPAYNEARSIGTVVALARRYGPVCVVDDGSTDATSEIARSAGAKVIALRKNGGYGTAARAAFEAAKNTSADAFVFLDGDFQHDPREIPLVAELVLSGRADVCVGSRFLGKTVASPVGRREAVAVINNLSGVASGKKLDFECGFRAFSRKAVGKITFWQDGYEACSEMLVSAAGAGLRIAQVPVTVSYYPERESSPLAQGAGLMSFVVSQIAKKKPLVFFAGTGLVLLVASALIGVFVVRTFYRTGALATGSALLTVFSGIAGLVLILIGINLYTLNVAMRRMGEEKR